MSEDTKNEFNENSQEENIDNSAAELNEAEAPSLESMLEQALKLQKESHENYLRALADFENFKKRSLKERSDLIKYQGERIFQDLLDIVDNFELAISHQDADIEQVKKGMNLIHSMFKSFLDKWEVKGESAIGKAFDPAIHNALSSAPISSPEQKAGCVVGELKKAYFYKDKLLRTGDVVVAVE